MMIRLCNYPLKILHNLKTYPQIDYSYGKSSGKISLHRINRKLIHSSKYFTSQMSNFQKSMRDLEDKIDKITQLQQQPNSRPTITRQKSPYIKPEPQPSQQLKSLAQKLSQHPSFYIQPLYHSKTLHYAAFLLSVVRKTTQLKLTQDNDLLKMYFRQIKSVINTKKDQISFTPISALMITEQLSNIQFDGDQSTILNLIASYVETNCLFFTQLQLQTIKQAYQKIMVDKAFGPVTFRALKIEKNYESQIQRLTLLIKHLLSEQLQFSQVQGNKQIQITLNSNKKWFTIKINNKNLTIITYPSKFQSLSQNQVYDYIYDLKKIINQQVRKLKSLIKKKQAFDTKIQIFFRQYFMEEEQQARDFDLANEKGIIYRLKKRITDQMEILNEMRKNSLKQQIQRMKQKKKQLKNKEKIKNSSNQVLSIVQDNQSKTIDFFETIKHHIQMLNQQQAEKINKRNQLKPKLKRKQRIQKIKKQNQFQLEDQDDQEMQEDEFDDDQIYYQKSIPSQKSNLSNFELVQKMNSLKMKMEKSKAKQKSKPTQSSEQSQNAIKIPEIQDIFKSRNQKLTIQRVLQKIGQKNPLKSIKQFQAYILLVKNFHKANQELDSLKLEKEGKTKQKKQTKNDNKNKFNQITKILNQPHETNILFCQSFKEIFPKLLINQKGKKINVKSQNTIQNSDNDLNAIFIMSDKQLIESLLVIQSKKINKDNKPVKQTNDNLVQSKKIFNRIFNDVYI